MVKPKFPVVAIILLIVFLVVGGLFFISVLGENNKANLVAEEFIQHIKNNNYTEISKVYTKDTSNNFRDLEELIKYHFALELSLLKHFSLLDKEDYAIKIERENLWIPVFKANDINLSISLTETSNERNMMSFFKNKTNIPIIKFFKFTRIDGEWKLKKINITSSPISNDFTFFKKDLDLNKYIEISKNGFHVKESVINVKKLPLTEKRILRLSMKKALEILK